MRTGLDIVKQARDVARESASGAISALREARRVHPDDIDEIGFWEQALRYDIRRWRRREDMHLQMP